MSKSKLFFLVLTIAAGIHAASAGVSETPANDPHYTQVGFFDIHVCNWQDRQNLFFMILFSSYAFEQIDRIEVFMPDRHRIGELDIDKYRLVLDKKKPEKRVFIKQFEIPAKAGNGWYKSIITMKDGKQYEARDYVIIHKMEYAQGMNPPDQATLDKPPLKLSWQPVPGAKHYLVFIKDGWEQRTIYTSKPLSKPELILPKGLISKNNDYIWRIHARDVNENVLLGDFNHGSLNRPITFAVD